MIKTKTKTERLILRAFESSDVNWYFEMVSREEFKKRLPGLAVETKEQAESDLAILRAGDFKNDFYYVIENKIGNVLGVIIAVKITSSVLDVSYFLDKSHRRKGYMREALKAFMSKAHEENPVYRFRMIVEKDNEESLLLLKSLGGIIEEYNGRYMCMM